MSEEDNIGQISQDSSGHKWGFEFSAEQVAEKIIALQVEAINNSNLSGQDKAYMISHLAGMTQSKMIQILNDNYHSPT